MAAGDLSDRERARVSKMRVPKTEAIAFCNLILEVIFYHGYILLIRSKSPGPGYIQEEGVMQGCEHQEAGIIGGHLKAAYHSRHNKNLQKNKKHTFPFGHLINSLVYLFKYYAMVIMQSLTPMLVFSILQNTKGSTLTI